mmetsp:Transcript_60684/g.112586  ORF Transcript_60684/g.112586 Transcript_60684/m.112586 type:complete len:178 (+) Transcript_60684:35-568(+)
MERLVEDPPLEVARRCKEEGNKRYVARDDPGALSRYREGLEALSGNTDTDALALIAILHANVAQVMLRQKRWLEVIESCTEALKYDPNHAKAAWRGAQAAREVGMRDVAISFVENGLVQDPNNKELLALRREFGPLPDGPPLVWEENEEDYVLEKAWQPPPSFKPKHIPVPGKDKAD